jgi:hypothetical protein
MFLGAIFAIVAYMTFTHRGEELVPAQARA